MKQRINRTVQYVQNLKLTTAILFFAGTSFVYADSCLTNYDNLAFGLVIQKTNLIAGERIPVSMTVSNMLGHERKIPWATGNPCGTGFGEYIITEKTSGKRLECQLTPDDRNRYVSQSLGIFAGHETQIFEHDLVGGYAVTNAGVYLVEATGRFEFAKSPGKYFNLTTPPITVLLSPRVEANASAK